MQIMKQRFFGCLFVFFHLASLIQAQCSASNPCAEGCCSKWGNCGYGPEFCGSGNCTSTCNAVAPCGRYAAPGKEKCPLNVCCSTWGHCGTTSEFCGAGCQNGCVPPSPPTCNPNSGSTDLKTIGYFSSWAHNRAGCAWTPENINPALLTHINFAFALIGADNRIASMSAADTDLYRRTTNLKLRNPALKVYIAVGGWDAGSPMFSNMARTQASRATFIQSVIQFMDMYAFDGIDLDWEYPTAEDRDGSPADTENYVLLVKELRTALGRTKGITVAIPASFWYLQHFNLAGMAPSVDWFNVMSYDIHGTWDGNSKWTEKVVQPHTNLSEIDDGLNLIWKAGVSPYQVVLGLAFYGRSFTLKDPSCKDPMCPFMSGGDPGPCSRTAGILSNAEISAIIAATGANPVFDQAAGVKWISWGGNQWVSYDDFDTFRLKKIFANTRCLAGTMIWALDWDVKSATSLQALAGSSKRGLMNPAFNPIGTFQRDLAVKEQNRAALLVVISTCLARDCPPGFRRLTSNFGAWTYLDNQLEDCDYGLNFGSNGPPRRLLCIEDDVEVEGCAWTGDKWGCPEGCPAGSIQLAANRAYDISNAGGFLQPNTPRYCPPGEWSSYCCRSVRSKQQLERCDITDFGSSISTGGLTGALINAAEVIRRRALVVAQQESSISNPSGQDINDNDGPADPNVGRDEITLKRRAGWNQYFTPDECDYIRGSLDQAVRGSGAIAYQLPSWWLLGTGSEPMLDWPDEPPVADDCQITITAHQTVTQTVVRVRGCDGLRAPQACMNYRSVAQNMARFNMHPPGVDTYELLCPWEEPDFRRYANKLWDNQHVSAWRRWVPNLNDCQRDEYPFFRMLGPPGGYDQYVRLLARVENNIGGQIPWQACSDVMPSSVEFVTYALTVAGTCWETAYTTKTQFKISIRFDFWDPTWDMPFHDYGLRDNRCLPIIVNDPGFALYTADPWYATGNGAPGPLYDYGHAPPAQLTQGHIPPRNVKREIFLGDPELVIIDERNSSRKATPGEVYEQFGVRKCKSRSCRLELAAIGLDVNGRPLMGRPEAITTTPGIDVVTAPLGIIVSTSLPRPTAIMTEVTSARSITTPSPERR